MNSFGDHAAYSSQITIDLERLSGLMKSTVVYLGRRSMIARACFGVKRIAAGLPLAAVSSHDTFLDGSIVLSLACWFSLLASKYELLSYVGVFDINIDI